MSLRLIEIVLPAKYWKELDESLKEHPVLDIWKDTIEENRVHLKILVPTENSETILDFLERKFSFAENFRIILLPVEASIPRPELPEKENEKSKDHEETKKTVSKFIRISREELYGDIEKTVRLTQVYFIMVVFSAIVASVGISKNNIVFIIGAMVIAPMLGPNIALSFATTLADISLSRKAIKTIAAGIATALLTSFLIGIIFGVDVTVPELFSRTEVSIADVILALTAGSAAAFSFTSELFSALIGVMVAVALLPPLVTLGMLAGTGHWKLALGSLFLFLVNLICVNLAGVLTFLLQGIRPLTWWEAKKAKRASGTAILIWTFLLTSLILLLIGSR
jgi:uncharacterized hydrophobic protein (TIGR00341 family)